MLYLQTNIGKVCFTHSSDCGWRQCRNRVITSQTHAAYLTWMFSICSCLSTTTDESDCYSVDMMTHQQAVNTVSRYGKF